MRLQRMFRVADNIVHFAIENKVEDPLVFLKQAFHPKLDSSNSIDELKGYIFNPTRETCENLDFFWHMDDYIKSKTRKVSAGMVRSYKVMKNVCWLLKNTKRGK